MIVTVEELSQTSLYPEVIAAITRNNPEAAAMQILAAESLCKTYLTKYDLKAAFGDEDTPPTVTSPALKKIVKMIASYYLVRMAAPNVNVELFRDDYLAAMQLLTDIRDGSNSLTELTYPQDDPDTPDIDESNQTGVAWGSNPKRTNHF
ncbi:MAG: DUF1320 family protein [Paludibacteraceae bacterium]|nr:DUF1320 family protein [Paludibacteraceae bacterium]